MRFRVEKPTDTKGKGRASSAKGTASPGDVTARYDGCKALRFIDIYAPVHTKCTDAKNTPTKEAGKAEPADYPDALFNSTDTLFNHPDALFDGTDRFFNSTDALFDSTDKLFNHPDTLFDCPAKLFNTPAAFFDSPAKPFNAPATFFDVPASALTSKSVSVESKKKVLAS